MGRLRVFFLFISVLLSMGARAEEQPRIVIPAEGDRPEVVLVSLWEHHQLLALMTSTYRLDAMFLRNRNELLTLSEENARVWFPEAATPCPSVKRGNPSWSTPRRSCIAKHDRQVAQFVKNAPVGWRGYRDALFERYPGYRLLRKTIRENCPACLGKTLILDAAGIKAQARLIETEEASAAQIETGKNRVRQYNDYRILSHYSSLYTRFQRRHFKLPVITDEL